MKTQIIKIIIASALLGIAIYVENACELAMWQLLFVFLMLWLFPTKSYVNSKLSGSDTVYDLDRLSVLYDEIFVKFLGNIQDYDIPKMDSSDVNFLMIEYFLV